MKTRLRLMPAGFRRTFGAACVADLGQMLEHASRFRGSSVAAVTGRACLDLVVRIPAEWLRSARSRDSPAFG